MTTNTKHETTIEAHPTLPLIIIEREFDAPPDLVFRAHVEPELVVQWLGPRRLTMRVEKYDARQGGEYRYVHVGEDGVEHWFHGCFHEVTPERLVQTFTYEGYPEGVSLDTMWIEDVGDGRTRIRVQSLVDSLEARDMMLSSGMDVGVNEGYQRLDELFERLA